MSMLVYVSFELQKGSNLTQNFYSPQCVGDMRSTYISYLSIVISDIMTRYQNKLVYIMKLTFPLEKPSVKNEIPKSIFVDSCEIYRNHPCSTDD